MSRFNAKNAEGVSFSYGFDRPLQEYFLQKHIDDESIDLVGFGSFPHIAGTNGNFLKAIEENGVNISERHLFEVACDVPFDTITANFI